LKFSLNEVGLIGGVVRQEKNNKEQDAPMRFVAGGMNQQKATRCAAVDLQQLYLDCAQDRSL
jgi:hypothetical protein